MIARTGLSARRSTRSMMSRSSVSSTPVSAPSTSIAFSSSSLTARAVLRLRAEQVQHQRGCLAQQPYRRGRHPRQQAERSGHHGGDAFRVAQRQLLGHQLAEYQGEEGDDQHGEHQRHRAGIGRDKGQVGERALQPRAELLAAEHAGEDADQCDAELRGGQEAVRVIGQRPGPRRAAHALALHEGEHGPPGGDQGKLGEREGAVEQDEQSQDKELKSERHGPACIEKLRGVQPCRAWLMLGLP